MRTVRTVLVALSTVAVTLASVAAVAATAATATAATATAATTTATAAPPTRAHYVNPFANPGWEPSRTDEGVDYANVRPLPVVAIGDAVILGSVSDAPWPGNHLIWYALLNGSHAGDIIYVAEHLKHLVKAGRTVRAGQQIAVAEPGYPWIETGFANEYGTPRAFPCYHEGEQTRSGREMARFLIGLGAHVADQPGPGPARPAGKLC